MSTPRLRSDELENRLASFGAEIVSVSASLPKSKQGSHVSGQILRSGTAAAANYGEARGAESRSDFVHKLRLVLKELNETAMWLKIIQKSSLLTTNNLSGVVAENQELCRIIAASIRTALGKPK